MFRAVEGTRQWVLGLLVQCFEALPDHLHVQPVTCHGDGLRQRLEVEADEIASCVQKKANKQWLWLAMDAKRLWAKMLAAYRQHATFYTDPYVVYNGVIPRHSPLEENAHGRL